MTSSLLYVYGVVPASAIAGAPPAGLDDAPVTLEHEGDVAALVSELPAAEYDEAQLERATTDLEWLGPRAAAHDRVLTWASDRGVVAPFALLTLFRSRERVREMLRERAGELAEVLRRIEGAREYGVRIYRIDSELLAAIGTLSERIAGLERSAAAATPGQRYLLERKLATERRAELRSVSAALAQEMHERLAERAVDAARVPIPRTQEGSAPGTLVLDGRYLVRDASLDEFRQALSAIVAANEPRGFRFDFTGPWPAYRFASLHR